MGNLVVAVMAAAILGVVSAPIMALSLQQVKDRADSQLSLDAEAKALAIRKQAASADSLSIVGETLQLTSNGTTTTVDLPDGCSVSQDTTLDVSKVTCRTSRGGRTGINVQPLYTAADFVAAQTLCYSSYSNQAALNNESPSTTNVSTIDQFNEILTAPGNSTGGGGGFFTKIHPLNDSNCVLAESSGGTYIHSSSGDPGEDNGDDDNGSDKGKGKDKGKKS